MSIDIFTPTKIFCPTGGISTEVFVKNQLRDGSFAYTEGICKGCRRPNKQRVVQDMIEHETTRTSITLVNKNRFRGGAEEIVVSMCSGTPLSSELEDF